jgi:hypothetical protein
MSGGTPAQWAADPSGRHDLRFWDGTAWTEHVLDAGVAGLDPVLPELPTVRLEARPEPAVRRPSAKPRWMSRGAAGAVAALVAAGGLLVAVTLSPDQARVTVLPTPPTPSRPGPVPTSPTPSGAVVDPVAAGPVAPSARSTRVAAPTTKAAAPKPTPTPTRRPTPKPASTPTPTPTAATPTPTPSPPGRTDKRYPSCAAVKRAGLGPYRAGVDPEYGWYRDKDGDGVVCE